MHPITPNTAKTGRSQYKCGFGCFEVVLININATKANDRAEIRYKLIILTLSEVKHPPSVVVHTITNKLDEIVIATIGEINQLIITLLWTDHCAKLLINTQPCYLFDIADRQERQSAALLFI